MDKSGDVGVALVDEEEDLLEYDNSMGSSAEQEGLDREDIGGAEMDAHADAEGDTDVNGNKVRVVSDNEIRQAAEQLLRQKLPQVFIQYSDHQFLLFDCEENSQLEVNLPTICEDNRGFAHSCNELFNFIRRFLEDYYGKLSFVSKEIILELPCLDLTLCEDNVYNTQITFSDLTTIFNILRQRSQENSETDVPDCIRGIIGTRPRFVSRYNTLVELTQSNATLKNIRPFRNDETHPLILDDNGPTSTQQQSKEVVVMNLEEDEDNATTARKEMDDKRDRSDSDELLEIVDNEE